MIMMNNYVMRCDKTYTNGKDNSPICGVDASSKAILGMDTLAVDAVACRFIDLDPTVVEHLKLVSEDRNEKLEDFIKMIDVVEPKA